MKRLFLLSYLALISSLAVGQRLQTPTLSPFSEIKQEIGLTEIKVQYSRPSAKGRTIFGDLVPYGQPWRTGANASTKLMLSETVKVGGFPVDSGTYAIYTIPGEDTWTIIIHSKTNYRSIAGNRLKAADDICRFEVQSEKRSHFEETFTMQFADMKTDACTLRIRWANTEINIPIAVEVDAHIEAQIEQLLAGGSNTPHRNYFEAAQYYYHNDKDIVKAIAWIEEALTLSKNNFRYGLLHAKILFKDGQRDAATHAINIAHAWAQKAQNANYIEQTALFREHIQR